MLAVLELQPVAFHEVFLLTIEVAVFLHRTCCLSAREHAPFVSAPVLQEHRSVLHHVSVRCHHIFVCAAMLWQRHLLGRSPGILAILEMKA